jgi:hypothetical protein
MAPFRTAGGRIVEKRWKGMFERKSMLNVCSLARETDG